MTQEFKVPGVLCYVDGHVAFFTTASLKKQWGDDWDDAPYEHNAGTPYADAGVTITEVHFVAGGMGQPRDQHCNSPWSVEKINGGATPWLSTAHNYGRAEDPVHIFAGATFAQFQAALLRVGGTALMPVPPDVAAGA